VNWLETTLGSSFELYQPQTITTKDLIENGEYQVYGANGVIGRYDKFNHEEPQLLITCRGATCGAVNVSSPYAWINGNAMVVKPKSKDIDVRFVEYFFRGVVDLTKAITGAAQPQITRQSLSPITFKYPSLQIQKKIVEKLDLIFAQIDKATAATEVNAKNAEALFQSYLSNIQAPNSTLGEHVTIKTGKLDSNASVENGKYPFFTCSKDIFSINEYAFDCEAVLLAGNNASGDFNVKHYKGKFNAYQRTYVITIDAEDKLTYRYLYFQLVNALKRLKSMSVGANTKFLKIGMIRDLEFPLPKMDEQIKILGNLSTIELKTDLLRNNYLKKLELSNKLKQSILKQAFNGELVKE
jgi:type I restriction enzyme S subunit